MKKLLAKIRKILKDRRTRQLLTRIVSITAAIVVFVTTYALVLPAITMESEANCGIPAHQHDDSCYEDRLICGQVESPGHQHTDACYSISKSLICTETEHQHDDSCFDADGNLTCEMAEHTHDDSCYEEVRELVCSIPESEGHEHTDDCYERILACGMEAHTHSTACYSHGSELTSSAPSDFAAVATTELGSYGATVSASAETDTNSEETSNTWASDESAAGGLSSTAAGAAATDYSSTATAADTASTGFDAATAEDAFVPQLEPIIFEQLLTKDTGIYYYHAEEGEEVPENSVDIADWKCVNDDTELAPADLLRVYLRYTIPAGALNATNDIARYRLPSNLHLTDQQMEAINTTVNGIANQYVNLDTLEITDTERYNTYLGIEATEGTRKPSDDIDEYFTNHPDMEAQEFINAVVRAENVFDETTEEYLGQDLVFTFTPYTVQKNQHEYDAEGQPTKAGQKVNGWLCFDLHTDQIDWSEPVISTIEDPAAPAQDVPVENTEDIESSDTTEATEKAASDMDEDASLSSSNPDALSTNTINEKKDSSAEIVFAAKDKTLKIDEISTELHQVELNTIEKENDAVQDEPDQSADDSTDKANSEMTDAEGDTADDSNPEGEADKSGSADDSATDSENQPESAMEINAETYPAVSFEDTITVKAGTLSTDNENAVKDTPAETAITVSVIAEEETFPLGTTMHLGTVEDMDTVASAVEGAVEGQTRGFHAVDISFHNAYGEEIEPLKPIKVSMTSDAIKQAVEDSSTAPVVVHVENPINSEKDTAFEGSKDSTDLTENTTDASKNSADADAKSDRKAEAGENTPVATIVEANETTASEPSNETKEKADTLSFDAGSFSVYAIVYTVDFHWEVDGKEYEYSLAGGDSISLRKLIEVLGVVDENAFSESSDDINQEADENGGSAANENSIDEFIDDIEKVEFSNPELIWVHQISSDMTAGQIAEENGLTVEYSAEISDEQKAEMAAKEYTANEWVLLSLKPFLSEETLTVTMKTGEVFMIRVTDAQIKKTVMTASGETYEITVTYGDDAGIPDGSELKVEEILPEDDRYQDCYEKALQTTDNEAASKDDEEETDSDDSYARFFDIEIRSDEEKIEPQADVLVNIRLLDVPEDDELVPAVVHFAENGPEVMDLKGQDEDSEDEGLTFTTDSFSIYGVIYTVDFHFEINGKEYTFSMPGGGYVNLGNLFEYLNVTGNADEDKEDKEDIENDILDEQDSLVISKNTKRLLAYIEMVEFSNPELVWTGKTDEDTTVFKIRDKYNLDCEYSADLTQEDIDEINNTEIKAGDWILLSIRAFETEETLTITLKDKQEIIIKVTDAKDAVMNDDGVTVQTIPNPSGTTITMFDYWIDNETEPGRRGWLGYSRNGTTGSDGQFWNYFTDQNTDTNGNNVGINKDHKLKFVPSMGAQVIDYSVNDGSNLGKSQDGRVSGINSWNGYNSNNVNYYTGEPTTGIVAGALYDASGNRKDDGYPRLHIGTGADNTESLDYLFNPNTNHDGKKSYSNADNLFYVDAEGYYKYDSMDYGAVMNKTTRQFTVKDTGENGFWAMDNNQGERNYWLGMHLQTEFSVPADGEVLNPKGEYKPMQFEFSGDDDAWAYVDGILVADGGGIHNRTELDINFKTGKVLVRGGEYTDLNNPNRTIVSEKTLYQIFFKAYQDGLITQEKWSSYRWEDYDGDGTPDTFAAGTYHTFDFFYLERGGGESNLYIKYNLVATEDFTAHKSVDGLDEDERIYRDDYQFELIALGDEYIPGTSTVNSVIMPKEGWQITNGTITGTKANGAGTFSSPRMVYSSEAYVDSQGVKHGGYVLTTGVSENGDVRYGMADIDPQLLQNDPYEHKYIMREVVPDDAMNADGVTWGEATAEQKAAGGFVKDNVYYDGKVYYMKGTITSWNNDTQHGLSKTYYTDDTFSEVDSTTRFVDFRNKYMQPLTLKVLKKDDANKALQGVKFKLTRARFDEETQKWVPVDGVDPVEKTTDASGNISFKDLTLGNYILEESGGVSGYKDAENKWLVTLTKQEKQVTKGNQTITVYELKPSVKEIALDGSEIAGKNAVEKSVIENTFEHEILNESIPKGDITVLKKWLKPDGVTEYTAAELEELTGIDNVTITGKLMREYTTYSAVAPRVTIRAKRNASDSSESDLWSEQVEYNSSVTFAAGVNGTQNTSSLNVSSGQTLVVNTVESFTYDNGGRTSGTKTYTLNNITQDTVITIAFNADSYKNKAISFKMFTWTQSSSSATAGSTETVHPEEVKDFTLNKSNNWTNTWARDQLNEQSGYNYRYYFEDVTENNGLDGFTFDSNEVKYTDYSTGNATYTFKNISNGPQTAITVRKVWVDGNDAHATDKITYKLRRAEYDKDGQLTRSAYDYIPTGASAAVTYTLEASDTYDGVSWQKHHGGLPADNGKDPSDTEYRYFEYSVVELSKPAGYVATYDEMTDHYNNEQYTAKVIRNTPTDNQISVEKKWMNTGKTEEITSDIPEGVYITGTLKRTYSYQDAAGVTVRVFYRTWTNGKANAPELMFTYSDVQPGQFSLWAVDSNGNEPKGGVSVNGTALSQSGTEKDFYINNSWHKKTKAFVATVSGNTDILLDWNYETGYINGLYYDVAYTKASGGGATHQGTEEVGTFRLDSLNGWQRVWTENTLNEVAGRTYTYTITDVQEHKADGTLVNNFDGFKAPEVGTLTQEADGRWTCTIINEQESLKTSIILKKVDVKDLDKTSLSDEDLLNGAKFKLVKYASLSPLTLDTEWNDANSVENAGTNGTFTFNNLPVGYYMIDETEYPDGYCQQVTDPIIEIRKVDGGSYLEVIQIDSNGNSIADATDGIIRIKPNQSADPVTIIVGNTPGAVLPNTGGPGTRLFTILGSILILGAGVLLWRRRRMYR